MKKSLLYFLIILITSTIIRLFLIDQPLLDFFPQRQTQTAEITRNIYINGWTDFWTPKVRYFTNGQPIPYVLEFPLYNVIVALLYHVLTPNIIWGRLASISFYLLSVIIFWKILLKNHSILISLFGILFFALSPLHILISRSFQPEELALFLLLLAIYNQSWFIFSLAILTKLPIILFAPLIMYKLRKMGKKWSSIIFQFVLACIPVFLWTIRGRELTIYPAISGNFQLGNWFKPNLLFDLRWYSSLFQIEQTLVLTAIGLILFWMGFWQKFNTKLNLWNLWLLCGAFYIIIFNNHAMVHEYYHIFLIPPLSIFVAYGLASVWKTNMFSKKFVQFIFRFGIIIIFTTGLILPAVKRILSAPKTPTESSEISLERYNYIIDF